MTLLLRLSLRNLFRHRLRTLLSMSAVIVGVWVLILGGAFVRGMIENIIRAQEDTFSGHVLLRPEEYPTDMMVHPVDELGVVAPDLAAWLDANATAWTQRILFTPHLVTATDRMRVRAFGFDPRTDEAVFPRRNWQVEGRIPATAADGVLLGHGLASLFELKPGDEVVLQARTSLGAINALGVPVAGIVSTGNPAIDRIGVFVPADLTQDLIRNGDGASHVAARLPHRDRADGFAAELQQQVGSAWSVATWRDETRDVLEIQAVRQQSLDMLVGILLLIAAAAIANTILMAAYERIREVGTLRAMGMTGSSVLSLFVIEGAMVGLLGSGIGAAVGGAMTRHWSTNGIDLSSAVQMQGANLTISAILYLEFSPATIVWAVVFGVVVAMLASVYPAYVAARMPPAEAVRA